MQTLRVYNSRILKNKNAKFSGYYFCMNTNIKGNFQICISVPLSNIILKANCHFAHVSRSLFRHKVGCMFRVKLYAVDIYQASHDGIFHVDMEHLRVFFICNNINFCNYFCINLVLTNIIRTLWSPKLFFGSLKVKHLFIKFTATFQYTYIVYKYFCVPMICKKVLQINYLKTV